ncbi:MAG: hypothetical protein ACD_7C00012G0001 [uncultured bacterium]|nr:MAG: hypothetical protein ACD_7C00012G0001 [uncultured bacterium]
MKKDINKERYVVDFFEPKKVIRNFQNKSQGGFGD